MFQNSILNRKNQNLEAKKNLFRRKLRQTAFGCLSARRSRKVIRNKKKSSQSDNRAKSYGLSKFSKLKTHCSCHVSKSRPRGRDFLPRQQVALTWTRFPGAYPDIVLTWTRFCGKWTIPVNNKKIGPFR